MTLALGAPDSACSVSHDSFLDKRLQPRERLVPLPGDAIEGTSRFIERLRLELEEVLASPANAPNQAGVLEHPKVLGDRLARERRTPRETRDRESRSSAELGQERQPRSVSQGGEYRRVSAQLTNPALTACW